MISDKWYCFTAQHHSSAYVLVLRQRAMLSYHLAVIRPINKQPTRNKTKHHAHDRLSCRRTRSSNKHGNSPRNLDACSYYSYVISTYSPDSWNIIPGSPFIHIQCTFTGVKRVAPSLAQPLNVPACQVLPTKTLSP